MEGNERFMAWNLRSFSGRPEKILKEKNSCSKTGAFLPPVPGGAPYSRSAGEISSSTSIVHVFVLAKWLCSRMDVWGDNKEGVRGGKTHGIGEEEGESGR